MKIRIENLIVPLAIATSGASAFAGAPVPSVGWNVDCGTHCNFSEFSNNCQGVYYYYPDGTQSYSGWSSSYNACQETAVLEANTHIIAPSQIQCGCPTPTVYPPANKSAPLTSTTRAQLELLRAQVHGWAVCSPDPAGSFPNIFAPLSYQNLNTCQYFRKHSLRNDYQPPGSCYTGLFGWNDPGVCSFSGDQLSNAVVNCLSGDNDRCRDTKDSQDPVTGMWYRGPFDRRHPETSFGQPLFSRDVLDGVMAYVAVSHDKSAFLKWLTFVGNNGTIGGFANICPPRPNMPKPAQVAQADWDGMIADDRCELIPEAAGQVYQVAMAVGITNAELNAIGTTLYSAMSSGSLTVDTTTVAEAGTAPALGAPGYQVGDTMDAINIRFHSGAAGSSQLLGAAGVIDSRTSYLEPSYHFLAENQTSTEYGAYLINKYCKGPRPSWGEWFETGWPGQGSNSTEYWNVGNPLVAGNYQYAGGFGPYGNKIVSSGQECIAWLNMYLGNGNHTELKCNPGDTLINGACEHYAFTHPTLAAIPGLDYKIRISDAKINYMAIDNSQCTYGGSFEPANQWGTPPRCSFPSGLSTSQLFSGVTYVVDPTETSPGIYYAPTQGTCPHGGSIVGANCELRAYPSPIISQGVHYWTDASPSWPGVYYQKISGSCPHGGVAAGPNCEIQGFAPGFLNTNTQYFIRSNPAHPGVYYYPQVIPEIILPNPINPNALNQSG